MYTLNWQPPYNWQWMFGFLGARAVMGVEVCLFLKGIDGDTKVRGNLRSKGDLDVSEIAANFGGGGHHAAAGFTNNGTIRETLAVALPMLAELVGEDPASVTVEL